MIDDIRAARDAALAEVAAAGSPDDLRRLDTDLLGKQGPLAGFKRQLGALAGAVLVIGVARTVLRRRPGG